MMDIPDHPDIRSAELTGYPRGYEEEPEPRKIGRCVGCGSFVYSDEEQLETLDGPLHDDSTCMRNYLNKIYKHGGFLRE